MYFLFVTETMSSWDVTFSHLESLSSNPLFSSIVTYYTLILLYFPHLFLRIVFSPVLILTQIVLLALIKHGETQQFETEKIDKEEDSDKNNAKTNDPQQLTTLLEENQKWVGSETELGLETEIGFCRYPDLKVPFVGSNVGAPLEIIYEEYEGEEDDDLNEKDLHEDEEYWMFPMGYSKSESGSSSDGEFPVIRSWDMEENLCILWDEEEREGMIEIALDGDKRRSGFVVEEDNLIEIDISPTGNSEFPGGKWRC